MHNMETDNNLVKGQGRGRQGRRRGAKIGGRNNVNIKKFLTKKIKKKNTFKILVLLLSNCNSQFKIPFKKITCGLLNSITMSCNSTSSFILGAEKSKSDR